ncbi:protein of unknown function DUF29 [Allochromatium warmingii]|uniref:DUF29 domain-containing protein n=1 Tax=Allochromatium warmingii TaxID=61595 RepID=A0A1H3JWX2_ALLWA|nr:DUF29 domain-containing protein [Allochromatium warmingii]SDY44381.1 protein of unknown function DUF29 [Allochromatium warmingii]
MTSSVTYEQDVIAWANEQARRLRAGEFDQLDIEHLAEEIEDVGKSEQRELASRMAILLMHLLKWSYQPARRGRSWDATIRIQRQSIERRLQRTPSLKHSLNESDWWEDVWADARALAIQETGLTDFPPHCPWSLAAILDLQWLPTEHVTKEKP